MLIDLHVRSKATTPRGSDPAKVVSAAREAGLHGVAFVEHLHSSHARHLIELGQEADFPVYVGVEIPTTIGRFLCFAPEIHPFTSREEWRQLMAVDLTPTYSALFELFDGVSGAVIAAQPYLRDQGPRLGDNMVFCDGLHGVEVSTAGQSRLDRALAVEAAVKLGLPTTGGSGAGTQLAEMGRTATLFSAPVGTQEALVAALREGNFWAVETGKEPGEPRRSSGGGPGERRGRGGGDSRGRRGRKGSGGRGDGSDRRRSRRRPRGGSEPRNN